MDGVSSTTWRFDRRTTPWLRTVSYVVFGAFGGLLVIGLLARIRLLQRGQLLEFAILVVALLVGPILLLGGLRYVRRPRKKDRAQGDTGGLKLESLFLAAVVEGALGFALISAAEGWGGIVIAFLFLLAFGGTFVLNVLTSAGSINTDTATIELSNTNAGIDLNAVSSAWTTQIGPIAFVWLSFKKGRYSFADPSTRRFLVLSIDAANLLERVIRDRKPDPE